MPTPALLLDVDAMHENIATMAAWTEDHAAIRPHFKVHKCIEIAREQISAGAIGMTAATVSEAAALVDGGIGEILIANEVVDATQVEATALKAAREIAALPAGAVAVSRRLMRGHLDAVTRQIDTEVMHFKDRLTSEEARAAFSAFLARKK